jgi:hypothetical protein
MKKNIPLIIAIALPIVLIVLISLAIFVPPLLIKPQHNFIYSIDQSTGYYGYSELKYEYVIKNDQIVLQDNPSAGKQETPPSELPPISSSIENRTPVVTAPTLYVYDVQNNSSREITFDEAKNYALTPGPSSPDGYIVSSEYNHNGIFELFGSDGSNSGFFITKNGHKKKLTGFSNLETSAYYLNGFKLIGWIK